jgi:hypothetical protein
MAWIVRRREPPAAGDDACREKTFEEDSSDILTEMPAPDQASVRTILIALGILLLAAGLLWPVVSRYFGRLPGDLVVRRPGFTFAFPLVTCLVLSLLLSLLLWLFRR